MHAIIDFWIATDQVHKRDASLQKHSRVWEPGFAWMMPDVKGQQQLIRGAVEVPGVIPKGLTCLSATLNVSVIFTLSKQTTVAPSQFSLNGPLSNAFDPGVVTFLSDPVGSQWSSYLGTCGGQRSDHQKRPFLCEVGSLFARCGLWRICEVI